MRTLTLIQFQYQPFYTPLGALYLAYGLEKERIDFDLKIYPVYRYGLNAAKLYSLLTRSGDIIAIGCWSDFLPHVIIALDRIKKKFPDKIIILGGIGPTEAAEEILTKFQFINFIIKGCGVYLLPELIKRVQKGDRNRDDIEGLVYRYNKRVISNYYGGFNLNIPDFPAYHRIDNIRLYKSFNIFTSFGCPYHCSYCYASRAFNKKVVYRDPANVIEEIRLIQSIKRHKKFTLVITDEAFAIDRKRVLEYCDIFCSEGSGISWACYGRIDVMDEELLWKMAKSGCQEIYYGVESGSNRILSKIRKGFTIEEAIKILLLSKKYIKTVTASFIYLFPFEQAHDFVETRFYMRYLQSAGILCQLHSLIPIKNSEIYSEYKKKMILSQNVNSPRSRTFNSMHKECKELIKNNPGIFPYYYSYKLQELNEILKLA